MFFIAFAGSLANNVNDLFVLFIIVFSSVILWDVSAYFLWKKLSNLKFFKYLLKNEKRKKIYEKSEKFFKKRWVISIFLSRFLITWIWAVINYIAWFQSFNFKKFTTFVILWEILYVSELLILWYIFKDTFNDIFNILSNFWFVLLFIFVLYETWKRLIKFKKIKI